MPSAKGFGTYRDYNWMHERYVIRKLPPADLAEEAGCHPCTIRDWLLKLGIPIRSYSEAAGTPVVRDRLSKAMEIVRQDPEYEERRLASIRKAWTLKKRAEHSAMVKQRYQDDLELRFRIGQSVRSFWAVAGTDVLSEIQREIHSRPEVLRKLSLSARLAWTNERKQWMSDHMRALWKSGWFDGIFCSPTSIENETRKSLEGLGIEYIEQYRPGGYTRIYDFYLPVLGVVVECQGDYFHCEASFPGISKRDEEKQQWALDHDLFPIELWEREIHSIGAKELLVNRLSELGVYQKEVEDGS